MSYKIELPLKLHKGTCRIRKNQIALKGGTIKLVLKNDNFATRHL
jgi:hypothetical protein